MLQYLKQHNLVNIPGIAIDHITEHYPPDVNIIVTDAYSGFNETDDLRFIFTNQMTIKRT